MWWWTRTGNNAPTGSNASVTERRVASLVARGEYGEIIVVGNRSTRSGQVAAAARNLDDFSIHAEDHLSDTGPSRQREDELCDGETLIKRLQLGEERGGGFNSCNTAAHVNGCGERTG